MRRTDPYVIPLKDNKFLILGGIAYRANGGFKMSMDEIEIFDADSGDYKIVNKIPYLLNYNYKSGYNSFAVAPINDRYILLTGGNSGNYPLDLNRKRTLILDLENNKLKKGPDMKFHLSSHQMLKMKDGEILIFDDNYQDNYKHTQVYKLK